MDFAYKEAELRIAVEMEPEDMTPTMLVETFQAVCLEAGAGRCRGTELTEAVKLMENLQSEMVKRMGREDEEQANASTLTAQEDRPVSLQEIKDAGVDIEATNAIKNEQRQPVTG